MTKSNLPTLAESQGDICYDDEDYDKPYTPPYSGTQRHSTMTIEITKDAFDAIIGANKTEALQDIATSEPARFIWYNAKGVNLHSIENFVSGVSQYYIKDINA